MIKTQSYYNSSKQFSMHIFPKISIQRRYLKIYLLIINLCQIQLIIIKSIIVLKKLFAKNKSKKKKLKSKS